MSALVHPFSPLFHHPTDLPHIADTSQRRLDEILYQLEMCLEAEPNSARCFHLLDDDSTQNKEVLLVARKAVSLMDTGRKTVLTSCGGA